VLHTPLHWLAYWGDWRAVRVVLSLNRIDFVQPQGLFVNKDSYIQKYGAFNAF